MKRYTTSPSRYFERQTNSREVGYVRYKYPARDNELIASILGAVAFGFSLGMLAVAAWAGVL